MLKNSTSRISPLRTSSRMGLSFILVLALVSMLFTKQAYARATQATQTSQYTIAASAGSNGTISPSGAISVNSGGSQTFTITPATGYDSQCAD